MLDATPSIADEPTQNAASLADVPFVGVQLPTPPVGRSATRCVRVLHVINGEHYSGAERVQDLLAGYLPAYGYDVAFACVKPGRFSAARVFRQTALYELPMRGRLDRQCGRHLASLVRDERFALVHAHTPRSLMVAATAAKLAGVPLIYHVHSPAGRDSTRWLHNMANAWLERRTAHRAARLIAVSPSVRRYMIEQGFLASRVVCVPNGVPAVDVPPRSHAPFRWTFGMTALFRPRKGIEMLLEALRAVRRGGRDVRLRAIGPFESPAYEAEVHELAKRYGLVDAITWTGFAANVVDELSKIDVLVLPSLFGEGLPMVMLEAMAAGVPVLASRVEGIPEAIVDGEEGLLVEPGDPGALAAAMEELLIGAVDYPALSRQAQWRHAERFSAEAMARGVAKVYDEALDSRQR